VIAILGATGYIGRSLARQLASSDEPLVLFARDPNRLAHEAWPASVTLQDIGHFDAAAFTLVINAVGAGDPASVSSMGAEILDVTQAWDQRVMSTMGPHTRYVFLSSGAVYGSFETPVSEHSELCVPVNRLGSVPPYTISKLYAETRHRHAPDRAILDLRVFAYADPAISLTGRFFLAELARSITERRPFLTSAADMVRDYAGAKELASLITCWREAGAPNGAADLYSKEPVSKLDLLAEAKRRYGLDVQISTQSAAAPTGAKPLYVSQYRAAAGFGYAPQRTSMKVVTAMLDQVARNI